MIKPTVYIIIALSAGFGCSIKHFHRADIYAKPAIEAINKYKEDFGRYPKNKRALIPDYIDKRLMSNVYYRLIHEPSDLTYQYLVKMGELKNGDVQYRIMVHLHGNVHCLYVNGKRRDCEWYGF